jgi:hypothetical protein
MALFTVLACNHPIDIRNPLVRSVNFIKSLKGDVGIFLIHELAIIPFLYLMARIPEYAAHGVIEKYEITLKIDFIIAIGDIFDENFEAILLNFFVFRFQDGIIAFIGRQ